MFHFSKLGLDNSSGTAAGGGGILLSPMSGVMPSSPLVTTQSGHTVRVVKPTFSLVRTGMGGEDGSPGKCDPDSPNFCCSSAGYCGNTKAHCSCPTCKNYNPSKGE